MINAAIVGATGYTGKELIEILLGHPNVRIVHLSSRTEEPKDIAEIFPQFKNRLALSCVTFNLKEVAAVSDLVFLALPHTASMDVVPKLLKAGKKVIDLSADYRLKNLSVYEKFYHLAHKDEENVKKAVYGLPELYREKIKDARLVANPGCYATCAILAASPLVALDMVDKNSIIIDAKSGVSGAGKKASPELLFNEANEDFRAYKVNTHQHIPEIEQVLSRLSGNTIKVTFVPHLLPVYRGILSTVYVKKTAKAKGMGFVELYKRFYKKEPFIRIKNAGEFPRLKDVQGTNFCDIGIQENADSAIIIAAIDNLLKGASGEAVQNMNIMYKFPETLGLI